jgi:hypothetical protein
MAHEFDQYLEKSDLSHLKTKLSQRFPRHKDLIDEYLD